MAEQQAGQQFYEERLAKARALPREQRDASVQCFLDANTLMEEALAVLPSMPGEAPRNSADQQLAAQLKWLQVSGGTLPGAPNALNSPAT